MKDIRRRSRRREGGERTDIDGEGWMWGVWVNHHRGGEHNSNEPVRRGQLLVSTSTLLTSTPTLRGWGVRRGIIIHQY
jgi:hypothetical protein